MSPGKQSSPSRDSDFEALAVLLKARPEAEIVLTFAEIEAIIGKPLSVTMSVSPHPWTQTEYAAVRTWLAVGWRAHPEQRDHAVRFTRDAGGEGDE